jgi:hypothetical protein
MAEIGFDPGETGWGRVVVGLLSFVGAFALVCTNLLSIYRYQRFPGVGFLDAVVDFPLSYVVFPAVVVVGWVVVGAVLVLGGPRAVVLGAVAFFGSAFVDLVVVATHQLGIRPTFLWFVDPVSPMVELPVRLLNLLGGPFLGYSVWLYVVGVVGVLGSMAVGGYLATVMVRTVAL